MPSRRALIAISKETVGRGAALGQTAGEGNNEGEMNSGVNL